MREGLERYLGVGGVAVPRACMGACGLACGLTCGFTCWLWDRVRGAGTNATPESEGVAVPVQARVEHGSSVGLCRVEQPGEHTLQGKNTHSTKASAPCHFPGTTPPCTPHLSRQDGSPARPPEDRWLPQHPGQQRVEFGAGRG